MSNIPKSDILDDSTDEEQINDKSIKECGDIGSKAAAEIITHYGARPKTSLEKILK